MHADAGGAEIDPLGGLLGDEGLRALVEIEGAGNGAGGVVELMGRGEFRPVPRQATKGSMPVSSLSSTAPAGFFLHWGWKPAP